MVTEVTAATAATAATPGTRPVASPPTTKLHKAEFPKNISTATAILNAPVESIGAVLCGEKLGLNVTQLIMFIIAIKICVLLVPIAWPIIAPTLPFAAGYLILGIGVAALAALAVGMILAADPAPTPTTPQRPQPQTTFS